jgi:preprotein translocase subunit SecF
MSPRVDDELDRTGAGADRPVAATALGRLFAGETAVDFIGRRRIGFVISAVLLVATVLSLGTRGLELGIDFRGGVVWDVPVTETFELDDAAGILEANGLDPADARIQERSSDSGQIVKVQVGDEATGVRETVQQAFADAAGVPIDEVSANSVSSTWGADITEQAVRALVVFLVAVTIFISIRFEWRMAVAALIATAHDVLISVGIYSIFGFVVTPATVIAFLTILGYSLYDTIVVFDRIKENRARFAALKVPYDDVVNVSTNQVLLRTLATSITSMIPVLSILVIGAWIMGATTLSEFAVALLVGMITGVYSSIFVAAPLLAWLWRSSDESTRARTTGEDLRRLVMGGMPAGRRSRPAEESSTGRRAGSASSTGTTVAASSTSTTATEERPTASAPGDAAALLSHTPRPRKKRRR